MIKMYNSTLDNYIKNQQSGFSKSVQKYFHFHPKPLQTQHLVQSILLRFGPDDKGGVVFTPLSLFGDYITKISHRYLLLQIKRRYIELDSNSVPRSHTYH